MRGLDKEIMTGEGTLFGFTKLFNQMSATAAPGRLIREQAS
jgi:hypothetical protein